MYGSIHIVGGAIKDIAYKMSADVAFTERDMNDEPKIQLSAKKINRLVESHIEQEYSDYVSANINNIQTSKRRPA
jgi:hypothetical protein